ncbi:MAG: molecular chaperone DnaJ [Deltaproteobacteria bacterium]|nr:molecular chaperone DnaJ [Deltaproteobacteria bacterium]
MAKRDYYEILGVSKSSTPDEIKKTYRKLALKYHPDRNPGDKKAEESFKEISEAYEILSDPQRKAQYDQYGHVSDQFRGGGGNPFDGSGFGDMFGDVFGEFFGGPRRQRGSRGEPGADLSYNMDMTFEQAAFGYSTELVIPRMETCDSCHGSGARTSKDIEPCRVCGGTGQQRIQQGFFSVATTCSSCRGTGKIIRTPCAKCHGRGRVNVRKKLKVNIPAGVDTGARVKLSGEGESGINGGPSGDLYLMINVLDHPIFERDAYDVYCRVPISITQASLGSELEVPTLEGRARLAIPAGTQNDRIFRLKNKGISRIHGGGKGDLFVRIVVEIPTNLNRKQKELLEEFGAISEEDSTPMKKTFMAMLKDFLS